MNADRDDSINATFELGGAGVMVLNVIALLRDHQLAGMSWLPTVWFAAWGIWNLHYYRALGQRRSWFAGMAIVAINLAWLALLAWYRIASR